MMNRNLDVAEDHRLQITDEGLRIDVQRLGLFLAKCELPQVLNFNPHIYLNYN